MTGPIGSTVPPQDRPEGAGESSTALIADIGATNARFGLMGPDGVLLHWQILQCEDYATLVDAARIFLATSNAPRPDRGGIAVAGPVSGDHIALTNNPWRFSIRQAETELGMRLTVVNDFTAAALSIPLLTEADRIQVGEGEPQPDQPIGILGPGTGLGVSGLIPAGPGRWQPLAGEGGHVTMAPVSDRESAVLAQLREQFDHVSAERVLSGQGLVNLYRAIAVLDGREPEAIGPAEVTVRGDPQCVDAVEMFCAMLGTVAGNLALTLGAKGGVYITGGIVPRLGPLFVHSRFRKRFTEKGRFRDYLGPIPTYVITHELPAFLGLKALV